MDADAAMARGVASPDDVVPELIALIFSFSALAIEKDFASWLILRATLRRTATFTKEMSVATSSMTVYVTKSTGFLAGYLRLMMATYANQSERRSITSRPKEIMVRRKSERILMTISHMPWEFFHTAYEAPPAARMTQMTAMTMARTVLSLTSSEGLGMQFPETAPSPAVVRPSGQKVQSTLAVPLLWVPTGHCSQPPRPFWEKEPALQPRHFPGSAPSR